MSQYETNETTSSGGTSFAADSPNVMARLPDIGAPDRDLDRDLPIEGRGRVLSSRLAMPILMGAAVVLLVVALAPFIFGDKENTEVAKVEPWQSETAGEAATPAAIHMDNPTYSQPIAGQEWGGANQPPAWGGNTVSPASKSPESMDYGVAPHDLSRGEQNGQFPQPWAGPNQLAPQVNPPQPNSWSSQPPLTDQWQNQAAQGQPVTPVPWTEPSPSLGSSAATQQPNASSAGPLVSSRPSGPGGYQGYQPSPPNTGYYNNYPSPDPSNQQAYPAQSGAQSITNQAATINTQNPAESANYGARETQGAGQPYADDSGRGAMPQPLDRWSPPGAASYNTQEATSPYPYDQGARSLNPTVPPSSQQPSVASYPYQPAPGLTSQPRPEAYPQLGQSSAQPPMTSSPTDSYGYPTAQPGQPVTNNFHQNQPAPYSATPAYGTPAPSGYGNNYSVSPTNPGAAQYGSRMEPTTRY